MSLHARALGRSFGAVEVLHGIDLDVAGKVALQGANGSGKTTLLRVLAGRLRPTMGTVRHRGQDPLHAAGRRGMVFVPADPALIPELTPLEHVAWWTRLHGSEADAAAVLVDAGLATQATRLCTTLSRGQRQRLVLATALACAPWTLLLDEPSTALDAEGVAWFDGRLSAFEGTVLAAVHGDPSAAFDDTLRLADGRRT